MKSLIVFLLSVFVFVGVCSAEVKPAQENEVREYKKIILSADVVHLDGAVIVERVKNSYLVKWNSAQLVPAAGEKMYGQKTLVGGTNSTTKPLKVVALIPFYEYRGTEKSDEEFVSVSVNGKPVSAVLFVPGKDVQDAIDAAVRAFPDPQLFKTQLDPRAPLLFIDAGMIDPGADLRIEYELKPRSMILN